MKVAILSHGLQSRSERLQPYRTLLEMGRQLEKLGHEVVCISDGASEAEADDTVLGLRVERVPAMRMFRGQRNDALVELVNREAPDRILWHLGLGSFIHQQVANVFEQPTIAVVTSPVHSLGDLMRPGPAALSTNLDLLSMHLSGLVVPGLFIRQAFQPGGLEGVITLSEVTRQFLIERGAPAERVWVVPPGVGEEWTDAVVQPEDCYTLREQLGFTPQDFVVVYFGSPAPVRGIYTMLKAVEEVAADHPNLRLLILSRRWSDQWGSATSRLQDTVSGNGSKQRVKVVDGFLQPDALVRHIIASDAVCLPFEIVPSDVPLSILEAMAVQRPVITTQVASLPELVADGRGYVAQAASVPSLAGRLREIVEQPDMAQRTGQKAAQFVRDERTWADMGAALEKVLAENVAG